MTQLAATSLPVLLVGAAVAVAVIARQLTARRLNRAGLAVLPLLLAFGALQQPASFTGFDAAAWAYLLLGGAAALVLGFLRGLTIRTWVDAQGATWTQGTALTLVLWAALVGFRILTSIGAHFAGVAATASTADALLMLALTFAAQNAVVLVRTLQPAR